jgi:hypothetical protein
MEVHYPLIAVGSHSHEKKNWKAYFREFLMLSLAGFAAFSSASIRTLAAIK